ncbi:MAG: hypothetical protein IBJ11_06735 [Phycisphaerales bacterium]|nr:hypothetical protein [Phycisphaerales bacterium]
MRIARPAVLLGLLALAAAPAFGRTDYPETEPNDDTTSANPAGGAGGMADGDTISGTTAGDFNFPQNPLQSIDYFLFKNSARPLKIYRHQLVFTSTLIPPNTNNNVLFSSIRGVDVTGFLEARAQQSVSVGTNPRTNVWYGFGKQEQFYLTVRSVNIDQGVSYSGALSTTEVTPVDIGSFVAGSMTISTVGQVGTGLFATDTGLCVYDANLTPVPDFSNNDEPSGNSLQSLLTRNFPAGTYYLAISEFSLMNDQPPASDEPPPIGTDGNRLQFPNMILCSSSAATAPFVGGPIPLNFTITDSGGTRAFAASKPGPWGIYWAKFTVVGGTPPAAFSLSTPANNAIAQERAPSLTWTASAGAATYAVKVATDPGLTNVVASATGLAGTSWTVSPPLNFNTPYYWGVTATNANGSRASTPTTFTFRTRCAGDVDRNGAVGANDLTIMLTCFGQSASGNCAQADLDGNGSIGAADLSLLLVDYGCGT